MTELTANDVWCLIRNAGLVPGIDNILMAANLFAICGYDTGICQRFSYEGQTVRPEHALDLIVGEMKRSMSGTFAGTMLRRGEWEAWTNTPIDNRFEVTKRYPSESEAVIAAYRAWKEGK